jgi:hypothetical protein
MNKSLTLVERFPPSLPCSCEICLNYCKRPGWWTLEEFATVLTTDYHRRVMLEVSPEMTFGVLSPAFYGCERSFATQIHSKKGCNFLKNNLCELYGTGHQPLECRFCHHERIGKGKECHAALENEWNTPAGRKLIDIWMKQVDFLYMEYYKSIIKYK